MAQPGGDHLNEGEWVDGFWDSWAGFEEVKGRQENEGCNRLKAHSIHTVQL